MKAASSTPGRLALLLAVFSLLALALSFGGAALLDRDARRLRAGEAARFDLEALVEKLKGAADDPSAGPLLAAATDEIARYSGPASGRFVVFVPRGSAAPNWPERLIPLRDELVLVPRGDAEAVGVARTLPAGRLLVARTVQSTGPLRGVVVGYALVTAALLLGLAALSAWLMGRLFTARIAALNSVFTAVEAGNIGARVPVAGKDELAVLSRHLNRMLVELERRIGDLRASSDRIAHDLRTPLARIGSRLSFLADLPSHEHPAQIEAAQREIADLIEAFNGLLDLREIETESGLTRVRFDLAEAATDAIELYEAVAEDQKGVAIVHHLAAIEIEGVPALMTRAVANLVDNALRAAPPGSTIAVTTARDDEAAIIEICDSGSGPPHEVIRALAEDLRLSSEWGGHGIGLSIVRAVARRHGGSFLFLREGDLTIAQMRIPLRPQRS